MIKLIKLFILEERGKLKTLIDLNLSKNLSKKIDKKRLNSTLKTLRYLT